MKILSICLLLSTLLGSYNCKKQENIELKEIEIIDYQLDSLLQNSINAVRQKIELNEKNIIILSIEKNDSDYYIDLSFTSRNSIDYPYREDDLNIIGFCTINNENVFIIDNYYPQLMRYLDRVKGFLFTRRKDYKKGKIPPPPLSNSLKLRFIQKESGLIIKYSNVSD